VVQEEEEEEMEMEMEMEMEEVSDERKLEWMEEWDPEVADQ
jgi:hypothetical protein